MSNQFEDLYHVSVRARANLEARLLALAERWERCTFVDDDKAFLVRSCAVELRALLKGDG